VWHASTGDLLSVLSGSHHRRIRCLAWSQPPHYLASSGDDGLVCLWDSGLALNSAQLQLAAGSGGASALRPLHSWVAAMCPAVGVRPIGAAPHNCMLAAWAANGQVSLFCCSTGSRLLQLLLPQPPLSGDATLTHAYFGCSAGLAIRVCMMRPLLQQSQLQPHQQSLQGDACSTESRLATQRLWPAEDGDAVAVAISPLSDRLAVGSSRGRVLIVTCPGLAQLLSLKHSACPIACMLIATPNLTAAGAPARRHPLMLHGQLKRSLLQQQQQRSSAARTARLRLGRGDFGDSELLLRFPTMPPVEDAEAEAVREQHEEIQDDVAEEAEMRESVVDEEEPEAQGDAVKSKSAAAAAAAAEAKRLDDLKRRALQLISGKN
uniref:WD_REPEATS_REGION domain-containing protein n=1 Tax=Macrostomum lignano TaxID=282301 RepID=A0A1I8GID4_9PLAT